jgi:hypothetical protein
MSTTEPPESQRPGETPGAASDQPSEHAEQPASPASERPDAGQPESERPGQRPAAGYAAVAPGQPTARRWWPPRRRWPWVTGGVILVLLLMFGSFAAGRATGWHARDGWRHGGWYGAGPHARMHDGPGPRFGMFGGGDGDFGPAPGGFGPDGFGPGGFGPGGPTPMWSGGPDGAGVIGSVVSVDGGNLVVA